MEAMYPVAKQANFAEHFVRTTSNWGVPWINNRIYRWRPFVYACDGQRHRRRARRSGDRLFVRLEHAADWPAVVAAALNVIREVPAPASA
jgi:hypothetical protein